MRSSLTGCAFGAALFGSAAGSAATAAAPAGNGQAALSVEVSAAGLRANGAAIEVPETAKKLLGNATAKVVELEGGRHVVHVVAPSPSGAWEAIVAGPLAGQTTPLVAWSGFTGAPQGDTGEERAFVVALEPSAHGTRVVVGEHRQDSTICGRPAIVSGRSLDPATQTLQRFASVQSLDEKERSGAKAIAATSATPTTLPIRLLRMKLASSAIEQSLASLNDGNLDTWWSEAKVGDGRGEFVSFDAAIDVPISALEIVVRPGVDVPHGVAPKTVFVATSDKLYRVTFPEDGFRRARSAFTVTFPEPLKTSCLAVVLDESYASRGDKDAHTTLTEVTAKTPYDGMSVEALVGALAGGGERARGAGAMLERGGPTAADEVIKAYPKLDDLGKELARNAIDAGAPCSVRAPFYGKQFEEAVTRGKTAHAAPGDIDPDYSHAKHQLTNVCKSDGVIVFVALLGSANQKVRLAAAEELALLSPGQAVPALIDACATADASSKSDILRALAAAARSPRAHGAVARELEPTKFGARNEAARICTLRAVGPELAHVEGGPAAFASLAVPSATFSTRYLLQAPAAELAKGGDANATAYLDASLTKEADPHVRVRAAEVAGHVPAVAAALAHAVEDPEVRVREAAINSLSEAHGPNVAEPIARRLAADDWTFVRAAAAHALGAQPPSAPIDAALAAALADASPDVRGRAVDALGDHHAVAHLAAVRELANKDRETLEVRARAITALGALCDASSVDALTKLAQRARQPFDDVGRVLGPAAIGALGALHPADLDARLATLLAKDAPGPVREMARSAKNTASTCAQTAGARR